MGTGTGSLKVGGSPIILVVKMWKYLLQYVCGVRFDFVVISLVH